MAFQPVDRPAMIASLLGEQLEDSEPLVKELSTRIILLSSVIEKLNQPMFQARKINRGLTTILTALRLSGQPYELHHQQLHERILLSSVSIFNGCESLRDLDLLTISSNGIDHTESVYKLTLDGIDVAGQVLVSIHQTEKKIFATLDEDEKTLLCKLLKTVTQQVDAS